MLKEPAVTLQCAVINLHLIVPNFARHSAVKMIFRADE